MLTRKLLNIGPFGVVNNLNTKFKVIILVFIVGEITYIIYRASIKKSLMPSKAIESSPKKDIQKLVKIHEIEKLYLNDKFLRAVKLANENVDSKSIVDRATKKPLEQVLKALENLDETNLNDIENFIEIYLHEPGIEITKAELTDWSEEPKFLETIKNEELKSFSRSLNKIWKDLYKQFDSTKLDKESVSSHLPMKHPFIVPGGRFIEIYYWDTYWTLEGLLVCGMFDTARQMIENFIYFIKQFGFIPNGSRVYYLNRSQPPYFSQMVMRYYEFCMNSNQLNSMQKQRIKSFVLNEALESMIKEYEYWMNEKSVDIEINKRIYKLNIFKANTDKPRPESYFEDIHTAKELKTEKEKSKLYCDIATAAESGYDFSSRWFKDPMNMNTIQTSDIIPVDLNSILFKTERILSELSFLRGDLSNSKRFKRYSIKRSFAINKILWSNENNCWSDYNLKTHKLNEHFYVSNFSPLWMNIKPPNNLNPNEIIDKHQDLIHGYGGGVPVSFLKTTQQWDFNNVWAPNQHSMIMMLLNHNRDSALKLARKFFNSVYKGWRKTGMIFEKYDVHVQGERGTGGEYEVQSGFGWTNGVIFSLINTFRDELFP